MKKVIVLFAMAAAVVGVQAAEVSLKVAGLVCEKGCVAKVKKSLDSVKGVNLKGTKFALGKKLGAVKVAYCNKTTDKKKILNALKKAGYKASLVANKKAANCETECKAKCDAKAKKKA